MDHRMDAEDPYRHHPVLRSLISDPMTSYFRSFRPADIDARLVAVGKSPDWRHSDAAIAASAAAYLAAREPGDLWVFAYGSLMWDPAIRFAEVRQGRIEGYARRFCMEDDGARGSPEQPGLMAALDHGPGCQGLVFRVAVDLVAEEIGFLWRREMIAPGYHAVSVPVETALGTVDALTFVMDHTVPNYVPDLTFAEQVRRIATAAGFLGTNRWYLENVARHFAALGIDDPDVAALVAGVEAYRA